MHFIPERFYHVFNEGNNGATLFEADTDDFLVFLRLMRRHLSPHADIVAYCLLPGRFHLLLKTDDRCLKKRRSGLLDIGAVSYAIKTLLSSYTRIVHHRRGGYGSLFRPGTRSVCLSHEEGPNALEADGERDMLRSVFLQIHGEPVRAGLVRNAEDWIYSSFLDYAGLRNGTLVKRDAAWEPWMAAG